jgi:hypothetical protein
MVRGIIDEDIKRVLIDRDIITLKQAFCRIMCAETCNKSSGGGETTTITFTPSQLFLRNRLQGYLAFISINTSLLLLLTAYEK